MTYGTFGSSLRDLPRLRASRRGRFSSWDRSGGNHDWLVIEPGESAVLADVSGAGCINHIWAAGGIEAHGDVNAREPDFLRRLVLRMFWDGEDHPSVLSPLGDFFGAANGIRRNFWSLPLQMSPTDGGALNCFFHMPFANRARIELASELGDEPFNLWYYVDYETFDALDSDIGRFHARFRRENPTDGVAQGGETNEEFEFGGVNLDGKGNYVILDAEGRGHYVGCVFSVRNLRDTPQWNWYGEGDDMIFIDGEPWPPSLHGTGTEDYFNTAACPQEEYCSPYHGVIHPGGHNWSGVSTFYRFHIEDVITFQRSIRVTIEHGHANKRSDDISSVAYWYQTEPHTPFSIPDVAARAVRSLPSATSAG